jgi:NAD(P)H-dependent FMN reductase
MVEAVARGAAQESDVETVVLQARDAVPARLLEADGFIFATPENLGSMSGMLKDFFDRTYYAALDRLNGRPYAAMICAGNDGQGAARQIERIVTGWRLKPVAPPLIVITRAQTTEEILRPKSISATDRLRCTELGQAFAAGLALAIY